MEPTRQNAAFQESCPSDLCSVPSRTATPSPPQRARLHPAEARSPCMSHLAARITPTKACSQRALSRLPLSVFRKRPRKATIRCHSPSKSRPVSRPQHLPTHTRLSLLPKPPHISSYRASEPPAASAPKCSAHACAAKSLCTLPPLRSRRRAAESACSALRAKTPVARSADASAHPPPRPPNRG